MFLGVICRRGGIDIGGGIAQCLYVFVKLAIERVARHRVGIAKNDELHASTGDGDIHTAQVAQEADLAIIVGAHKGNQDNVAFLSLETVDGVDGDKAAVRFEE